MCIPAPPRTWELEGKVHLAPHTAEFRGNKHRSTTVLRKLFYYPKSRLKNMPLKKKICNFRASSLIVSLFFPLWDIQKFKT